MRSTANCVECFELEDMVLKRIQFQIEPTDIVVLCIRSGCKITKSFKRWLNEIPISTRFVISANDDAYDYFKYQWLMCEVVLCGDIRVGVGTADVATDADVATADVATEVRERRLISDFSDDGLLMNSSLETTDTNIGYDILLVDRQKEPVTITIGIERSFYEYIQLDKLDSAKRDLFWQYILVGMSSSLKQYREQLVSQIAKTKKQLSIGCVQHAEYVRQIALLVENGYSESSVLGTIKERSRLNDEVIKFQQTVMDRLQRRLTRLLSVDDNEIEECIIGKESITNLVVCDSDCMYQFQNLIYWLINGNQTCPLTRQQLGPDSLHGDSISDLIVIDTEKVLKPNSVLVYYSPKYRQMLKAFNATSVNYKICHAREYINKQWGSTHAIPEIYCLSFEYNRIVSVIYNVIPITFAAVSREIS
jgi:hypothetical protein